MTDNWKIERKVVTSKYYDDWTVEVNTMLDNGWELKEFKMGHISDVSGCLLVGYLERIKTPENAS